jgi:hypothetical protein
VLFALFFFLAKGVLASYPLGSIPPWSFVLIAFFFFLAEGVLASLP